MTAMSPVQEHNPFNELYLSEAIDDPGMYSRWFSPTILTGETTTLFRRGNTVLRGSNGVGKTMLLRLFSAEVRSSYLKDPADRILPVELARTLGINVNFLHAGFGSLGMRVLHENEDKNRTQWGLAFGDLLNCYMVARLMATLEYLASVGRGVGDEIGARLQEGQLDHFARRLSRDECWFGALDGVSEARDLTGALHERVQCYRSFINWNRGDLPESVTSTRTVIGTPLVAARKALLDTEVIDPVVALVITLDQYESLYHVDYGGATAGGSTMGGGLCRVVNSLLALRTPGIFFKVGVRHYAWRRETRVFNTDQQLELGRDYQLIDLDQVLRRPENPRTWIFPRFATDVAARRIEASAPGKDAGAGGRFRKSLKGLTPQEEVERYCRGDPRKLRATQDADWPEEWAGFVERLFERDKYYGKLAEVWVRQKMRGKRTALDQEVPSDDTVPWKTTWWAKERREALLSQIASDCQQRRLYAGWDTLLVLSGGNILVFINLCREIWDHWQRAISFEEEPADKIPADIQSQAVRIVASDWLEKQEEFPRGSTRRRFVVRLGIAIRARLLSDRTLSYPGNTGFSLVEEEWKADDVVREFLNEAVEYGSLVALPHTTKKEDRRRRTKWYLAPILCPNFEIPATRTKEPYYASVGEVRGWITSPEMKLAFRGAAQKRGKALGRSLFDADGDA